jgi:hypothetical protein
MARGQCMVDEDDTSNSYHEHVQATTTLANEEIIKNIVKKPSLEDLLGECFDKFGGDLDLDKLLKHVDTYNELSLEDPLEECFAQFEFDLDLNMI